jgi:hypothetical protein
MQIYIVHWQTESDSAVCNELRPFSSAGNAREFMEAHKRKYAQHSGTPGICWAYWTEARELDDKNLEPASSSGESRVA